MNYIGVDCHISSLDFAVVNERGTTTRKEKVRTGVKELIRFVKSVPQPRKIFIEEGTLASWALEERTPTAQNIYRGRNPCKLGIRNV
jgi:hypothetical protein